MSDNDARAYRVMELGPIRGGIQLNEPVTDFDSLETHHPGDNHNARMHEGTIVNGQKGRVHGFIGGEVQEIEVTRNGRTYGLAPDQVLLKKDFILEDPDHPERSSAARAVDVPSPVAGYIGKTDDTYGLVDIYDRPGGEVIARIRHMKPIAVEEGQFIEYGQSLGTQSNQKTPNKHVHMEMDTRYYQQFENYVSDLVGGRLPIEAEHRENVEPQPVIDDGIFRLGESGERVRDLQRVMAEEGYRAAGGQPLDQDGVYRLGMQGAVLDFQRDHGVPQTGDVDPATLRFAPPTRSREVDRQDHFMHGQSMPPAVPEPPTAPGHPDHPDHRPGLPDPLEPPVNQRGPRTGNLGDPQLDRLAEALLTDDDAALSRIAAEIERSPEVQAMVRQGHQALAEQERQQEQERQAQQQQSAAHSLG
ncbi:peptidoglycan DD-metalloendopeptidase family protein [Lysobacter maris]|uniref:Peptidoglycan DD-metalloendopeptidase family protein n=1 Tax=Marilutibacter maris TaxID=1605891 RepID=A0A508B339_9GAMM|nr:peptidoglycan-binding protein [Lysobacter maris]KAB8198666.1 peptidoglycan DD-metalloendopeptidase family protein [Lysobacter maris]